jgi:hypothetical protein
MLVHLFCLLRSNFKFEFIWFEFVWIMLGNSVKACHPRNVGLPKFMKQVRKTALWKRFAFVKKRTKRRVLTSFRCFASSWTGMELMAKQGPCILTFDVFQDMQFLWKPETRKLRKYGIRKSRESGDRGPAKPWNHGPANLCVQISEIRLSRMEDSEISRKPS